MVAWGPVPAAAPIAERPEIRGPERVGGSTRGLAAISAVAALATLGLASWRLGAPSLWLDEAFTAHDAARPLAAILGMTGEAYGGAHHPPLYFLVVRGATLLCGSGEACLRAPSAIASAAAAALVVVIAGRLFGRVAGIFAGALWASLPYALKYATQARHYSLLAALGALTLLLALRASGADDRGPAARRVFVGLGLAAAAMVWTHLVALPWLAALALACVGWARAAAREGRRRVGDARRWSLAALVFALALVPLAPALVRVVQTGAGGHLASRPGPADNAAELLWHLASLGALTWVWPALALVAGAAGPCSQRTRAISLVALAVVPFAPIVVRAPEHFVTLRYFMPSLVALSVVVAAGAAALVEIPRVLVRGRPRVGLAAAVVVALALVAALAPIQAAGIRRHFASVGFEPWDQVAARVGGVLEAGDAVVAVPFELVRFPLAYYGVRAPIVDPGGPEFSDLLGAPPPRIALVSGHVDRPDRRRLRRDALDRLRSAGCRARAGGGASIGGGLEVVVLFCHEQNTRNQGRGGDQK